MGCVWSVTMSLWVNIDGLHLFAKLLKKQPYVLTVLVSTMLISRLIIIAIFVPCVILAEFQILIGSFFNFE